MNATEIMMAIYNLPKNERDSVKENVFGVIQKAQRLEEQTAWENLLSAVENWKRVAELDEIIIEHGDAVLKLSLDQKEPGGFSLEEF